MIRFLLIFLFGMNSLLVYAQDVQGKVINKLIDEPLEACTVSLYENGNIVNGVFTNEYGEFSIETNAEEFTLQFSFLGFKDTSLNFVRSSDELINIIVELEPSFEIIAFPQIRSKVSKTPGTTLLTKSFFKRIPGAFDDPSRLLIRFPSISIANDGANQIVVKGLAPHMALWAINGAFIVNPNHLSNAGTLTDQASASGGGTNMISGNSIGKFEFITSPLNSNYFDGASGVSNTTFSIPEGIRYSFGLLGTEASFAKNTDKNFYYGINYRYSTLGILTELGVDFGDEEIRFQDVHLSLGKKWAYAKMEFNSLWGNNRNFHESLGAESISFKDMQRIDFKSSQWLNSLSFNLNKSKIRLASAINYSIRQSSRVSSVDPLFIDFAKVTDVAFTEQVFSFANQFDYLINENLSAEFNTNTNLLGLQNKNDDQLYTTTLYGYAGIKYNHDSYKASLGGGVSLFHNEKVYPEIRSTHTLTLGKQKIKIAYANQHHGISPFLLSTDTNVDPFGSQNISLDYYVNTKRAYWNIGVFYHNYYNLPVSEANGITYFDRLDLLQQDLEDSSLNNEGKADIYGLQGQWEMINFDRWQMILAGSWYDMMVDNGSEIVKTSYDFGYTGSASLSYSIPLGTKELILSSAFQMRGAEYHAVINESISELQQSTIFDLSQNKRKVDQSYNRLDFKVDYLFGKNKKHTLSLDIQNVLNNQNFGYFYYDPVLQSIETQNQLGLIPIIKFSSKI